MTKKGGANNTAVNSVKSASNNVAKANNGAANNSSKSLLNKVPKLDNLKNSVSSVVSGEEGKGKSVVIGFLILIGLVILVVGGYYLYKHLTDYKASEEKTKILIPYIQDAKVERIIQSGSIPTPSQGNEFNMNFWIYISDYNYRKEHDKCILYRGSLVNADSENNPLINSSPDVTYERCNPGVWLLKYVNTLRIVVGLETKYDGKNESCEHFAGHNNDNQNQLADLNISIPNGIPSDVDISTLGNVDQSSISPEFDISSALSPQQLASLIQASLAPVPQVAEQSDPVPTSSVTSEPMPTTSVVEPNVEICDVENIPLQRWVNINVSVHDNVIDIAMDGQLVKSCILSGAPYISTEESLYVSPKVGNSGAAGGFNGYLSNLQYTNKALPLNRIYQTYKNGPTIKKGMF